MFFYLLTTHALLIIELDPFDQAYSFHSGGLSEESEQPIGFSIRKLQSDGFNTGTRVYLYQYSYQFIVRKIIHID